MLALLLCVNDGTLASCATICETYACALTAGLIAEWSASATAATGIESQAVLGKNASDILSPPAAVSAAVADALAGKVTDGVELSPANADGVRLLLQVAPAEGGGVMMVGQNVSRIVSKRGGGGADTEALLAQAVYANEAKSKFLITMSHEMRTPLSVIMGMNDLVLETRLEHEQLTFVEQIKTSAEGLLVLLNDIVDLTKIEAGKLEQNVSLFDMRAVFEDAIDSVAIKGVCVCLGGAVVCVI